MLPLRFGWFEEVVSAARYVRTDYKRAHFSPDSCSGN
jgi:hypothetical protein